MCSCTDRAACPTTSGSAGRPGLPRARANVGHNYIPLVGDFNGNGHADILWYGPGANRDVLWFGKTDGVFSGYPATVRGHYEPLLGDFNGDRRGDIFWYGPGANYDVVWYGRSRAASPPGRDRARHLPAAGGRLQRRRPA